jgi:hypothetical protein
MNGLNRRKDIDSSPFLDVIVDFAGSIEGGAIQRQGEFARLAPAAMKFA